MVVGGGSMSKVRVYEVAKQLNLDPKAVVGLFQSIGVTDVRNHMSSVDVDAVERLKRNLEKQKTHDVVQESIRRGPGTVLKRRAVGLGRWLYTLPFEARQDKPVDRVARPRGLLNRRKRGPR